MYFIQLYAKDLIHRGYSSPFRTGKSLWQRS